MKFISKTEQNVQVLKLSAFFSKDLPILVNMGYDSTVWKICIRTDKSKSALVKPDKALLQEAITISR